MKENFYGKSFRFFRLVMRVFLQKHILETNRNITSSVVYISHHQNFYGPLMTMIWFHKPLHLWALHVFCDKDACCKQIVEQTFMKRFNMNRFFATLLSKPISYPISKLVNSSKAIPVYRSSRNIVHTFKESVEILKRGEDIIIFPDLDYANASAKTEDMFDGFLHIERYYHKATGKHVCFIPLYASKGKKTLNIGKAICFKGEMDYQIEKEQIYDEIKNELNRLAIKCGDI